MQARAAVEDEDAGSEIACVIAQCLGEPVYASPDGLQALAAHEQQLEARERPQGREGAERVHALEELAVA